MTLKGQSFQNLFVYYQARGVSEFCRFEINVSNLSVISVNLLLYVSLLCGIFISVIDNQIFSTFLYIIWGKCHDLHSAITKTRLFKYIETFTTKKYHISAQNIDRGYSLEPPRRGSSNEYPHSMFLREIWKIICIPVNPSFTR